MHAPPPTPAAGERRRIIILGGERGPGLPTPSPGVIFSLKNEESVLEARQPDLLSTRGRMCNGARDQRGRDLFESPSCSEEDLYPSC